MSISGSGREKKTSVEAGDLAKEDMRKKMEGSVALSKRIEQLDREIIPELDKAEKAETDPRKKAGLKALLEAAVAARIEMQQFRLCETGDEFLEQIERFQKTVEKQQQNLKQYQAVLLPYFMKRSFYAAYPNNLRAWADTFGADAAWKTGVKPNGEMARVITPADEKATLVRRGQGMIEKNQRPQAEEKKAETGTEAEKEAEKLRVREKKAAAQQEQYVRELQKDVDLYLAHITPKVESPKRPKQLIDFVTRKKDRNVRAHEVIKEIQKVLNNTQLTPIQKLQGSEALFKEWVGIVGAQRIEKSRDEKVNRKPGESSQAYDVRAFGKFAFNEKMNKQYADIHTVQGSWMGWKEKLPFSAAEMSAYSPSNLGDWNRYVKTSFSVLDEKKKGGVSTLKDLIFIEVDGKPKPFSEIIGDDEKGVNRAKANSSEGFFKSQEEVGAFIARHLLVKAIPKEQLEAKSLDSKTQAQGEMIAAMLGQAGVDNMRERVSNRLNNQLQDPGNVKILYADEVGSRKRSSSSLPKLYPAMGGTGVEDQKTVLIPTATGFQQVSTYSKDALSTTSNERDDSGKGMKAGPTLRAEGSAKVFDAQCVYNVDVTKQLPGVVSYGGRDGISVNTVEGPIAMTMDEEKSYICYANMGVRSMLSEPSKSEKEMARDHKSSPEKSVFKSAAEKKAEQAEQEKKAEQSPEPTTTPRRKGS